MVEGTRRKARAAGARSTRHSAKGFASLPLRARWSSGALAWSCTATTPTRPSSLLTASPELAGYSSTIASRGQRFVNPACFMDALTQFGPLLRKSGPARRAGRACGRSGPRSCPRPSPGARPPASPARFSGIVQRHHARHVGFSHVPLTPFAASHPPVTMSPTGRGSLRWSPLLTRKASRYRERHESRAGLQCHH